MVVDLFLLKEKMFSYVFCELKNVVRGVVRSVRERLILMSSTYSNSFLVPPPASLLQIQLQPTTYQRLLFQSLHQPPSYSSNYVAYHLRGCYSSHSNSSHSTSLTSTAPTILPPIRGYYSRHSKVPLHQPPSYRSNQPTSYHLSEAVILVTPRPHFTNLPPTVPTIAYHLSEAAILVTPRSHSTRLPPTAQTIAYHLTEAAMLVTPRSHFTSLPPTVPTLAYHLQTTYQRLLFQTLLSPTLPTFIIKQS